MHQTHEIRGVPVTMPGSNRVVGKALIENDGNGIKVHITLEDEMAIQLVKSIRAGVIEGLSMGSIITPAIEKTDVTSERPTETPLRRPPNHSLLEGRAQYDNPLGLMPPNYYRKKAGLPESHVRIGPREIQNRFGFHKATIEGPNATATAHRCIRVEFENFANFLDSLVPEGREKDLAYDRLEEASMWFHKAVAKSSPLIDE